MVSPTNALFFHFGGEGGVGRGACACASYLARVCCFVSVLSSRLDFVPPPSLLPLVFVVFVTLPDLNPISLYRHWLALFRLPRFLNSRPVKKIGQEDAEITASGGSLHSSLSTACLLYVWRAALESHPRNWKNVAMGEADRLRCVLVLLGAPKRRCRALAGKKASLWRPPELA